MPSHLVAKKLARAERRVTILEKMIEEKTREVFLANEGLREAVEYLRKLQQVMPGALVVVDRERRQVETINDSTRNLLGVTPEADLATRDVTALFPDYQAFIDELGPAEQEPSSPRETHWRGADGRIIPVLVSSRPLVGGPDRSPKIVFIGVDLRDRKRLEAELHQAQKLESIGQLAAGIAHEINTPMQFIGDNVSFLQSAFADLQRVVDAYEAIRHHQGDRKAMRNELKEAVEEADLDYLRERGPQAFDRTRMGVERVAKIVRGMKVFAHPEHELSTIEIQEAIETTLTVAHHEYRYVAELETSFEPHLSVVGYPGDFNQVLLNLIVNASHAMSEGDERGRLSITTKAEGDDVVVEIADTGAGIPEEIRHRIFDPFFTTKEVGQGTGQGLALAHRVITKLHGGSITFSSELGRGTTFTIRLPMATVARGAA